MKAKFFSSCAKFFRLSILLSILTFHACHKEDPQAANAIQFAVTTKHVMEGMESTIEITLDRPSPADIPISVSVQTKASYNKHYTSNPEVDGSTLHLIVNQGQKSVQFTIKSINNNLIDNGLDFIFTLDQPPSGLKLGTQPTLKLIVDDDEAPSVVNFEKNGGLVNELKVDGEEIKILLSAPALATGSITISVGPGHTTYGNDFETIPETVNSTFTLVVQPGETSTSFTFLPIHNYKYTSNQQITFTITATTASLSKGAGSTYSMTILNEDSESIVNFAMPILTLDENNKNGIVVDIPFSAEAPGEGSITISISSPNIPFGNTISTIPATTGSNTLVLPVVNKQSSASFKILPQDNQFCTFYDVVITFVITFANGSVKKGDDVVLNVTLKDDEIHNAVSFEVTEGSILENDRNGIEVNLNFAHPASASPYLTILSNNYLFPPNYSTNPESWWNEDDGFYIILPVVNGATNSKFTVYPINNNINQPNSDFLFWVVASGGSGCLYSPGEKYHLTILNDD